MAAATGRILKSHDVKVEGQFQLNLNNAGVNRPQQSNSASTEPHVQITESQPEYAVIEVVCQCGSKIYIKCEYGNIQAQEG